VEHGGSEWVLDAQAEGCAIERRLFTRTEASEVLLRFGEPASVDLGIDWTEDGPDSVRVRLVPPEGPEVSTWLCQGESERLGPVLPGIFRVFVRTRTGEVSCTPGEITLAPGLNSVVLRLGLLYEVVVAFGEDRASTEVTVGDDEGDAVFQGEVGSDGDLRIGSLVPGAYRLWLMDRQRGSMAFTVPGPSRFLFVPDRVDCLRVVIQNTNGLLARWGLRDGDLVAAVDGTEIPNAGTAGALLELAATRERSVLSVLRNGDRFDLEVLSPTFDSPILGGCLVASAR
jgi:hypothetical protein